jgi:CheY-like chemotaxis protein
MPKRILLADDSITIQKVVELTFSDGDYEVTAVNNGAKAIQKLGEMRPDIILSDIIMPEKNGYEVCEHVKSHPEYRNIPVVLLTGTFEPFDPDRAEKAGCDAVVTKPFESQSLIHKVEELIANAQTSSTQATAAVAAPESFAPPAEEPPASPWMDDVPAATTMPPQSLFTTSGGTAPVPAPESFTHDNDIFGAPPAAPATTEMPFDTPADPFASEFSGETRAFPRMSFDDFGAPPQQQEAPQQEAPQQTPPPPPPAAEPLPWDDQQDFSGETRAFGKMSFDDLQQMAPQAEAQPQPAVEPSDEPLATAAESEPSSDAPFGAPPPAEEFSAETRAFQRMSFDELQQLNSAALPQPEPQSEPEAQATPEPEVAASEASPWDEPASSPFGEGETRAFPQVSFDELQQQMSTPAPEPEPEPLPEPLQTEAEPSPWEDQPAFESQQEALDQQPAQEGAPWDAPAPIVWSPAEQPATDTPSAAASASADAPMIEDLPFASSGAEESPREEEPSPVPFAAAPLAAASAMAEPGEAFAPPPVLAPEAPAIPIRGSDLSDEQIEKIARRVVELMSEQVVRNIAWEVIPDLAEMVVKERIRQLESEN